MKKFILSVLIIVLLSFNIYGVENELLNMRNKIFEESEKLKPLVSTSEDSVLISSMWDTCLITITQIDAYFFMLGIFDTIEDEDLSKDAIYFVVNWLKRIKHTNNLSLKGLYDIAEIRDSRAKAHVLLLKNYFNKLDNIVDAELNKVYAIQSSLGL